MMVTTDKAPTMAKGVRAFSAWENIFVFGAFWEKSSTGQSEISGFKDLGPEKDEGCWLLADVFE